MPTRSEEARARLRDEMKRKGLVQRDVAGLLNWSQSRVAKVLTGRVVLSLEDLTSLCFALGLSVVEVVRDRGMEFCAEMTPTELRFHERVRAAGPDIRDALIKLMNVGKDDMRRAAQPRQTKKRK